LYLSELVQRPAVREQRFRAASQVVAGLLRAGHVVFSPIVHCHLLVQQGRCRRKLSEGKMCECSLKIA